MTRDDIINMAKEAGCDVQEGYVAYCDIDDLCELVRLATAAEREACAELCMSEGNDIYADRYYYEATFVCAAKIRARTTP